MTRGLPAVIAALWLTAAGPLFAHHSFAAEFDLKKPVTLQGVVTKVEWTNPHIYIYVDVKDHGGHMINWACEMAGPNTLTRRGWSKNALKTGDQVTVAGFGARDGSHVASAREVTLASGQKVFAGAINDGGPQP